MFIYIILGTLVFGVAIYTDYTNNKRDKAIKSALYDLVHLDSYKEDMFKIEVKHHMPNSDIVYHFFEQDDLGEYIRVGNYVYERDNEPTKAVFEYVSIRQVI